MKKILIVAIAISFAFASNAQTNVVKLNPLGLLFGSASLGYEKVLNKKSAFQINGNYGSLKISDVKYSNVGGGVDYRYYPLSSKEAPRGLYVSPGVAYSSITVKVDTEKATVSSFVGKALVGYQWVFGKSDSGFALDLFGGVSYYGGGKAKISGVEYGKFSGILPALGVSLGYAF